MTPASELKIKIQLMCGDAVALGPGKADLLDAIGAAGSISGAARAMEMSYRRAWQLVDLMNRCWREPLVETSPGRAQSSGARLTEAGIAVLASYRALQASLSAQAQGPQLEQLIAQLRPRPLRSQADRADPQGTIASP
ncbi:winged helix-turn-helix domain-containing protein [Novosphingobium sp. Chol11]|uniref:winged helix-turn-helix domain-containing protein n=1 Tax=Novosphingobium sp. Chol11 TaxID=1385763 RepID=UPI0025E95F11|nr:LysR family transcriptional regulator [Novosphingobium sp. Chol11]